MIQGTTHTPSRPLCGNSGRGKSPDITTRSWSTVGHVAHPSGVGAGHREVALQMIRRDGKRVLRIRRDAKLATNDRPQPHLPHPFGHSILSYIPALSLQRQMNFGTARSAFTGLVGGLNGRIQTAVFRGATTGPPFLLSIESTARYLQHVAYLLNIPLSAVLINETVALYPPSEKMAKAFLKISRSRRRRSFSRCRSRS